MSGAFVWPRGVTFTSATLADHGEDAKTGMMRRHNGSDYILVKNGTSASGTIADGLALMPASGQTTTGVTTPLLVVITTGVTVPVVGANNTGATVAGDHYFWAICCGAGYAKGGTIGDGLEFSPAANGLIGAATNATDTLAGYTISDVTTTVANRVVWNCPASGPAA